MTPQRCSFFVICALPSRLGKETWVVFFYLVHRVEFIVPLLDCSNSESPVCINSLLWEREMDGCLFHILLCESEEIQQEQILNTFRANDNPHIYVIDTNAFLIIGFHELVKLQDLDGFYSLKKVSCKIPAWDGHQTILESREKHKYTSKYIVWLSDSQKRVAPLTGQC